MPDSLETATLEQPAATSPSQDAELRDDGDQLVVPPDTGAVAPTVADTPQLKIEDTAKPPAPDTAPKADDKPVVPPGYVRESDLAALRSTYDRRIAAMEARETAREAQIATQVSAQVVETQVEAARREVREWLTAAGVDPAQYAGQVENIAKAFRRGIEGDQKAQAAQQEAQQYSRVAAGTVMAAWVNRLAPEHKLDPEDVETLQSLYDPTTLSLADQTGMARIGHMLEARAKQLGEIRAAATAAKRTKQAEVPTQKFENGQGAGGMTDQQIVEAFSEGKLNDFKQAEDAMKRLGTW